jgi:hypothetical protein
MDRVWCYFSNCNYCLVLMVTANAMYVPWKESLS